MLTWLDSVGGMAETCFLTCRGVGAWDDEIDPMDGDTEKSGMDK